MGKTSLEKPPQDKQVIKKQASILKRNFFLFEQKVVKILLQSATLWSSNVECWFLCALVSWGCACEIFHLIPI